MKKSIFNGGLVTSKPRGSIPSFDYASLYPTNMQNLSGDATEEFRKLMRIRDRNKKLNKILNNINNINNE